MTSRYDEAIARLREAAVPDRAAPSALEPYLDTVRRDAFRVTDGAVAALREAGFTEDELFEHTVSAAVGAGLARLEAARRAMR